MPNITNPDAFQLEAATLLAAAYSAFPTQFDWKHDSGGDNYPTETGQTREEIQLQTIRWLIKHGYLSNEFGMVGGEWKGLGLTERGLVALNSVPEALAGKDPLGKRLAAAVATGSADVIKKLIPVAIQQAFAG